jgi:hypothetical protein
MDTIGKEVFGIHPYCLGYEFVKSREQMHVQNMSTTMITTEEKIQKHRQAGALDNWTQDVFGITAIHSGSNTDKSEEPTVTRRNILCYSPIQNCLMLLM